MGVPALLNPSVDTFNTWLDATNNLISHAANTSATIQLSQNATPTPTTGNLFLNGTATVLNLVVNGSTDLAGTNVNVSANVYLTGTTLNMTGFLQVAGNIGTSGDLAVTGNGNIGGAFGVTGNTTLSGGLAVVGNTALGNALSVAGTLTVNGATTLNGLATLAVANITGNLTVLGVFTANSLTYLRGNVSTNAAVLLSGPFGWSNGFVVDATLVGGGPHNDVGSVTAGYANCTIIRVDTTAEAYITGLQIDDPTKYRELIFINVGNYDIHWLNDNNGSLDNNRIACPQSEDFTQPAGSAARFIYDAGAPNRWRIISVSSAIPFANTTVPGLVSTGDQTFAGAKSFTNIVNLNAPGGRLVLPVGTDMWAV